MTRHDKIKKIIKKLDQNNFSIFPIVRRVAAQLLVWVVNQKKELKKD